MSAYESGLFEAVGSGDEPNPRPEVSTEDMVREIHGWLSEVMPAARLAVKMMNARNKLIGRWTGAGRND